MTRNTNGEMWHLDYNPGFHSIAGQIEQQVGSPLTSGLLFLQPVYYKSPAVLLYSENRNDDVSIVQDLFSHVSLDNYIIFNEGKTIKIFY